jgi:hypothetical protein
MPEHVPEGWKPISVASSVLASNELTISTFPVTVAFKPATPVASCQLQVTDRVSAPVWTKDFVLRATSLFVRESTSAAGMPSILMPVVVPVWVVPTVLFVMVSELDDGL